MTDDEALVRRVVAGREDDLPRLVYADWLDDRGDPRGPYLRAELDWAARRPADPAGETLRPLAAGLDPVWVARVTRTPAGVCADHVRWDCMGDPPGPPLGGEDFRGFEASRGVPLPAQYRAFLLNQNGGAPYPNKILLGPAPDDYEPTPVDEFVRVPAAGEPPWSDSSEWGLLDWPDLHGTGGSVCCVARGGSGDRFYLGTVGETAGQVFHHPAAADGEWDPDRLVPVAGTLGGFLDRLVATEPGWARMIVRGNTAGVARWLAAGGDPNAVDPGSGYTPLMYAVDWRRADVVDWLLARGARPTRALRDLAGYADPEVARRVDAALRRR